MLLDISAIIPTKNRKILLYKTLQSIAQQKHQPKEIIIIDASEIFELEIFSGIDGLRSNIVHNKAIESGAAKQRNQGITLAKFDNIAFFDDDIYFEEDCIINLFKALNANEKVGGVNALITNQIYHKNGKISTKFYQLMSGSHQYNFAGKCIGPAINFLPADEGELINKVDWLNTTCTMYKKHVLPIPAFPLHLVGYSLMEDLTLSLIIGQTNDLFNVRTARIYHDTQESTNKHSVAELAKMDLVNRFYIIKNVMKKDKIKDYFKLFLQQLFSISVNITGRKKIKDIPAILKGKFQALREITK